MTIYIVDIEAVDTRYTKQWKEYLPKQLRHATNQDVQVISGGDTSATTSKPLTRNKCLQKQTTRNLREVL